MIVSRTGLAGILSANVGELKFIRRTAGPTLERRMLCTLDFNLLKSKEGRMALRFKPSNGSLPYDAASKNLLVVWDIMMQDWRAISMDQCDLISTIKSTPPQEFWEYFNKWLAKMSAAEKMAFMLN